MGGYKVHPRVFLITDGKATPAGMISGPDRCSPGELDIVRSLFLFYEFCFLIARILKKTGSIDVPLHLNLQRGLQMVSGKPSAEEG